MTGFAPPDPSGVSGTTQRLIVRYAKRGRMRFASHRDVARAVERGVRRAGLPIAYSAGFTPHPKISYAGAAPTGAASEAEYLELSLTERCAASEVRERLGAALPDGMDVIDVTEAAPSLAALPLEASCWRIVLPGVPPDRAVRAVTEFLGCQTLEVERLTSKGTRRVDARAAVVSMAVDGVDQAGAGNATLRMVVRHVIPAVRPDEILTALSRVAALAPSSPPLVTRLAQGAIGRWSAPGEQPNTTRHGAGAAATAATPLAGACNQFPRGADGPFPGAAPGSLTGDYPDARERAERQTVQQ